MFKIDRNGTSGFFSSGCFLFYLYHQVVNQKFMRAKTSYSIMLPRCIYQVLWSQRESRLSILCDERRLTWLGYRLAQLNSGVHPKTST